MSKEYDAYLRQHLENVRKAYDWCIEHNIFTKEDLPEIQLIYHDQSKFTYPEYDFYDNYFYPKEGAVEDEVKNAFEYAWLHHIHNNPHHWNYWVLPSSKDSTIILDMSLNYILEMLCDYFSFSFKKNDLEEVLNYYKTNKNTMALSDKTRETFETYLKKIENVLYGRI